jgi:hypothetical protein
MTDASEPNPLDPMRVLREQLAEVTAPIGLELQHFTVIIGAPGEPDLVQTVSTIDVDAIGRSSEQAEFDQKFASIAKDFQADKQHDKEQDAIASLEEMRKRLERGGDGFLGTGS